MDFDSNNKTLRPIYNKLDCLIDKGYDLSNVFKDILFRDCNQFDRDYRWVPCWVRDAGNTAECGWTKEEFETFVMNYSKDGEIVHRWLYYYDCDMLVCALCDRFKMIASMLRVFTTIFLVSLPAKWKTLNMLLLLLVLRIRYVLHVLIAYSYTLLLHLIYCLRFT